MILPLNVINEGLEKIDTTKGTTEKQLLDLMAALPHDSIDELRAECETAGYQINIRILHDFREKEAVKNLNSLAKEFEVTGVKVRADVEEVVSLYEALGATVPADRREELIQIGGAWKENGGDGDLPDLGGDEHDSGDGPESSDLIAAHVHLRLAAGSAFRLKSKAFMLTFNCLAFVAGEELWSEFQTWVATFVKHSFSLHV